MRALLLAALMGLASCGPLGPSIAAGASAVDKAKVWIWSSKPELEPEPEPAWHAGHCDYDKRYWCNGGQSHCCAGCGARCN